MKEKMVLIPGQDSTVPSLGLKAFSSAIAQCFLAVEWIPHFFSRLNSDLPFMCK